MSDFRSNRGSYGNRGRAGAYGSNRGDSESRRGPYAYNRGSYRSVGREGRDGGQRNVENGERVDGLATRVEEMLAREHEREWYDQDVGVEESLFVGENQHELSRREERYQREHTRGFLEEGAREARRIQPPPKRRGKTDDHRLWEANRISSATAGESFASVAEDAQAFAYDDEEVYDENRRVVIVKDTLPRFILSLIESQPQLRSALKDLCVNEGPGPSGSDGGFNGGCGLGGDVGPFGGRSDLAVAALRGSQTMKGVRERAERLTRTQRFWELSGSSMGTIVGVDGVAQQIAEKAQAREVRTATATLGSSMARAGPRGGRQSSAEERALIDSSRTQLPIYKCRDELLRLVSENDVLVVVGETGSGKTTQLCHYLLDAGFSLPRFPTARTRPSSRFPPAERSSSHTLSAQTALKSRTGIIDSDEDPFENDPLADDNPRADGNPSGEEDPFADEDPFDGGPFENGDEGHRNDGLRSKDHERHERHERHQRHKRQGGRDRNSCSVMKKEVGGQGKRYQYTMIGCTQPRRIATVSVAARVALEVGCVLGKTVGYSIRFEDCTSESTRVKYMTDAFLLREILSDPDLSKYDIVVMDEAHERSLSTDVLFGLLKSLLKRRRDLRVIITSATMNAEAFATFFGDCPIFKIPGRTHPVRIHHAPTIPHDYVDAAVQRVLAIHCANPYRPKPKLDEREGGVNVEGGEVMKVAETGETRETGDTGDILVFMTGQEDVECTCLLLSERALELQGQIEPLLVLPIYSQLPADLQAKVFERSAYRKVIVATNIAETSLTLEGVRFVVDPGFCKLKVFNPRIGMDALQLCPISRANADQRAGRAGRTAPGVCYRLYTETAYLMDMAEHQVPELLRTNLANVVLLLMSLGVSAPEIRRFGFLNPPSDTAVLHAMKELWLVQALDDDGALTDIGRKMAQMPVDPSLSRMIIQGEALGVLTDTITIVALLSVPSIFQRPKTELEEAEAAREKFMVPDSDHLTLLNVYNQWLAHGGAVAWCKRHFIHYRALVRVRSVRDQLLDIASQFSIPRKKRGEVREIKKEGKDEEGPLGEGHSEECPLDHFELLRKVIASGYVHHAARLKVPGQYVNLRTSVLAHLHPTSALFANGSAPEYVVYNEVILTTKEYMQVVTAVEPAWLATLPGFSMS